MSSSRPAGRMAGFTYMEALIAMVVMVTAMAIALSFFVDFGAALNTESTKLAKQQSARFALDDLTRMTRQIGYGVRRTDIYNKGAWQRSLVYGGSHELAFNADIDPNVGTLPSSQTLSFLTGPDYAGQGIGATTVGAETYVYTLDANADGALTAADRTDAATGSFNPAAENANPHDFALFRRVYGFNGTDYGGEIQPLTANLFTNATADAKYPDNTSPEPLFAYQMSEDLNQDGSLQAGECVNTVLDTCPPATERKPVMYLWGDTDFDGVLSEAEKTALRGLEVGSAAWAPNPLVAGGAYKSTTLSVAASGAGDEYDLQVADASKFGPGYLIQIGTGSASEIVTVESVATTTTPNRVALGAPLKKAHAAGVTVTASFETLLRAVRAVDLNYAAMSDQRDTVDGVQLAGRAGGLGTKGFDYRVTPVRRSIRVINATTGSSPGLDNVAINICPLKVVNACSGTDTEQSKRYIGVPGQQNPTFLVTDSLDNIIPDVTVDLTQTDTSVGLLTFTSIKSDDSGLAEAAYVLAGSLGSDTVTATVSCTDSSGTTHTSSATNQLSTLQLNASIDADCMSTVSPRTATPTASFSIEVSSGGGPVSAEKINLGLQLDQLYMADSADFTTVIGGLAVGGTPVGTTTTDTGELDPAEFTTDTNGRIEGTFGLAADSGGDGARLNLVTEIPQQQCASAAATFRQKVDFFKLTLDPIEPKAECSTVSPCVISAGAEVPQVQAELSIGGSPMQDAPLTLVVQDQFAEGQSVTIPTGVKTPASKLIPPSGIVTDNSGIGIAKVSNNGSPEITPTTSLETIVDVTTTGPPDLCTSGTIASSSDLVALDFHTPMSVCETEMLQSYVVKRADDKLCLHIKNKNEADGGCPQAIKGIKISMYEADGVTLDPGDHAKIKEMKGGAVSTSVGCSTSDAVQLFKDDCQDPKAILNNGQDWMFRTYSSCKPLKNEFVQPGEFFVLGEIRFDDKFISGNYMDVMVYFECSGECEGGGIEAANYRLRIP